MTKIRPPRAPKGEDMKTTIANQECMIKNLMTRIEVLSREVGTLTLDRNAQKQARIKEIDLHDSRLRMLEELEQANKYQEGYIARVKEEDQWPR
jgi:hypothetical protein